MGIKSFHWSYHKNNISLSSTRMMRRRKAILLMMKKRFPPTNIVNRMISLNFAEESIKHSYLDLEYIQDPTLWEDVSSSIEKRFSTSEHLMLKS